MATIIKRKKSYSVVYNYKDENGKLVILIKKLKKEKPKLKVN